MRNLQKKVDYLKDILGEADKEVTESSGESDDEVAEIQPKKKNITKQRLAVSAEVYGAYNKKADFVPKVV